LLAAAFTCERVLVEQDNVISAIRLVDTVTVNVPTGLPGKAVPVIKLWAVIYFKSGEAPGGYTLTLKIRNPDGKSSPLGEPMPIHLRGGSHGVQTGIELQLAVERFGLFWIDVLLDGEPVTAMPLTLVEGVESPTSSQSPAPNPKEQ
jgi:hypothetical protein